MTHLAVVQLFRIMAIGNLGQFPRGLAYGLLFLFAFRFVQVEKILRIQNVARTSTERFLDWSQLGVGPNLL